MKPFVRLLLVTVLALAVGFFAGLRTAASFERGHHRWMPPPVPGDLAFYEPLTTSSGASTPVAAPDRALVRPDPAAQAAGGQGRQLLIGYATWYATGPSCLCAAAGPTLRHGDWRGSMVTVCAANEPGHCVQARISDACWCIPRHDKPTLLDLSDEAFAALAPLSRGIVEVTVTWP